MRASGGISNERNSTRPSRPVGPSGEYSLSMQISARWVLPVTSTRRLRNNRSTSHGGGASPRRLRHEGERDLAFVQHVLPRLVDARRLAGRADEQPGEQVRERRPALPVEHDALEQIGPAQERAVGARSAPPSTTWLPPPVPVWRPSIMNLSVPSRREPGVLVEPAGDVHRFGPACRRVDVDLDHAGIGRDLDDVDARIVTAAHSLRRAPAFRDRRRSLRSRRASSR